MSRDQVEYTRDQSIESEVIATPTQKHSEDKKGLSTIKQEPPTEQRCHSQLTTQQKIDGSIEINTARLSREHQLERNLLEEIKDIQTIMYKDQENKENFPTPKPYSHIVHNSLKLEEDEDVFRIEDPLSESPDALGVEAAFIPSRGYEEELHVTPTKASFHHGESLHLSTIDPEDQHDGRSTVLSTDTNHIFKKRTPLANIQNMPQSALRGVRQSNRSVSAQPAKPPPSTADLIYSYSNASTLNNPYKDNAKLNSCRSNSETSSFLHSQRVRGKRSGKSSDSHMSVFREVGNEIVNHSVRSNESESHRFFTNFGGQNLEIKDEFQVTQKSARSARGGGASASKLQLLHKLGLSQEKDHRQLIDREAEQTHKLLQIQEQRRLLKKLLTLSREQHRVNDEIKIQEMLDFLQIAKRPLPASEVRYLHTLEMVSSPYDEELTRMIKTQRGAGLYKSGYKHSAEKDKAEIKRQRELRKRLTEEKIQKISGVYGSSMKRGSSSKLSAKKVLALNLSKEKEPPHSRDI